MCRCFINFFHLLRFQQWPKNLMIIIPVILSKKINNHDAVFNSILIIAIFCLLSSSVYIMNDIADINRDKLHPQKKNRVLPSGLFSIKSAAVISLLLAIFALASLFFVNKYILILGGVYILLNVLYTFLLKNIFILDIMIISVNYLLRFLVGAFIVSVLPSKWLFMCGIFLALFLVIGKRRQEISSMISNPSEHKILLAKYTISFIDELLTISGASLLILYILYVFDERTAEILETSLLPATIPFAMYVVFKYLYIIRNKNACIDPIENILHHRDVVVTLILWMLLVFYLIYFQKILT